MKRRKFIEKTVGAGAAGVVAPSLLGSCASRNENNEMQKSVAVLPFMPAKDDISIAQWSLVDEIRQGLWTTLDFPKLAREEFDINGIEFVNTLFEVPHMEYLNQLKRNAADYGVTMVLIMVDAEGDPCSPEAGVRTQYAVNHRKWIDVAHYLGCHSIRTNCRGAEDATPEENLQWAADSYRQLLEYASRRGLQRSSLDGTAFQRGGSPAIRKLSRLAPAGTGLRQRGIPGKDAPLCQGDVLPEPAL